MIEAIRDLIRQFRSIDPATPPGMRAKATADSLASALQDQDLPRCRKILALQLHLLDPELDTGMRGIDETAYPPDTPDAVFSPPADPSAHDFLIQRIVHLYWYICQDPRFEDRSPGVAILHHIWLGSPIGEDRMTRIHACWKHLRKIWFAPDENSQPRLRHLLWTDHPPDVSRTRLPSHLEIRDYRELLTEEHRGFAVFVESFIRHGELSFAADVLRPLILDRFGGLFLGVHWGPSHRPPHATGHFTPTQSHVKCFFRKPGEWGIYTFPLTIGPDDRLHASPDRILTEGYVDTEMLYAGKPGTRLSRELKKNFRILLAQIEQVGPQNVIRNHRKARSELVASERHRSVAAVMDRLYHDSKANTGAVVNTYPLVRSLIRTGLCIPFEIDDSPGWSLAEECRFPVSVLTDPLQIGYHVKSLGLVRPPSLSWLNIPRNYSPVVEW